MKRCLSAIIALALVFSLPIYALGGGATKDIADYVSEQQFLMELPGNEAEMQIYHDMEGEIAGGSIAYSAIHLKEFYQDYFRLLIRHGEEDRFPEAVTRYVRLAEALVLSKDITKRALDDKDALGMLPPLYSETFHFSTDADGILAEALVRYAEYVDSYATKASHESDFLYESTCQDYALLATAARANALIFSGRVYALSMRGIVAKEAILEYVESLADDVSIVVDDISEAGAESGFLRPDPGHR